MLIHKFVSPSLLHDLGTLTIIVIIFACEECGKNAQDPGIEIAVKVKLGLNHK